MNYQLLSRVLKYGLVDTHELSPFLRHTTTQMQNRDPADEEFDDIHNRIMADYLQDRDDPRGDILRKQYEGPVGLDAYDMYTRTPYNSDFVYIRPPSPPHEDMYIDFYPAKPTQRAHDDSGPTHIIGTWSHMLNVSTGGGMGHTFSGAFTPEEARLLANKLPEPHQEALHKLIDNTFPEHKRKLIEE